MEETGRIVEAAEADNFPDSFSLQDKGLHQTDESGFGKGRLLESALLSQPSDAEDGKQNNSLTEPVRGSIPGPHTLFPPLIISAPDDGDVPVEAIDWSACKGGGTTHRRLPQIRTANRRVRTLPVGIDDTLSMRQSSAATEANAARSRKRPASAMEIASVTMQPSRKSARLDEQLAEVTFSETRTR
jgi:hypothetical protein